MRLQAEWLNHPGTQILCTALEAAGHQALFVGGCVRNGLLDLPTADIDIATDAHPDKVIEVATAAGLKTIPTGIDHGTVTVIAKDLPHEVTTFRRDVETDGRRAVVAFAKTIEEDARRRDFTMNALYTDPRGQVIDPLGTGIPDLTARRLRFIEDPHQRIREDYLRILRFFRFHAFYADPEGGFDTDGLSACAELAEGIDGLSKERVGAEMLKLLGAADPAPAISSMAQTGVLARALPGADAKSLPLLIHAEGEAEVRPNAIRRLAALGGDTVKTALRLSNADAKRLAVLRTEMGAATMPGALGFHLGAQTAIDVLLLRAAVFEMPLDPDSIRCAHRGARQRFPIRAADLMEIGLEGPEIGHAMTLLTEAWISSDFKLDKPALLARLNG